MEVLKNLHKRTQVMICVTIILVIISLVLQGCSDIEKKYLSVLWLITTIAGIVAFFCIYLDTEEE